MIEPPAPAVAGPVLVTERSADPVTVVSTLSSLLDGSGSEVVPSMFAAFATMRSLHELLWYLTEALALTEAGQTLYPAAAQALDLF